MKKLIFIQFAIMTILVGTLVAQSDIKEAEVKSTLKTIFKLSGEQNYANAASLFFFSNNDEKRNYNYNVRAEEKAVKRMAKKIKAYLNLSDSYEFESISYSKLMNLPSAKLKVNFASGNQELSISFTFVKLGSQILLVEFK